MPLEPERGTEGREISIWWQAVFFFTASVFPSGIQQHPRDQGEVVGPTREYAGTRLPV